jgi:protein TonB
MAVTITLLILLGFLGLNGTVPQRPQFKGGPLMIDLKPDSQTSADVSKSASKAQPRPKPASVKVRPPMPIVKTTPPLPTKDPSPYILLSKEEYEKFELANVPRSSGAGQAQQPAQSASAGEGDSKAVGTAPDGQPLYQAQWYRRPTQAELNLYRPAHMPIEGWGLVACKTAARYHVEDCVELGNSPAGSHLAGAVRQAAWQFLVRPPRLGGKDMVGTWVRIRIDYHTIVSE